MRIIYCLAGTFNSGGMEKIIISKANWLAEQGHKVFIITTEQQGRLDFFPLKNVERIDLDINYSETISFNLIRKFFDRIKRIKKHEKALIEKIEAIQPDIVISSFGNEINFLHKYKHNFKIITEIHFSRWYRILGKKNFVKYFEGLLLSWMEYNKAKKYNYFVCLTKEDKRNWRKLKNVFVIPNFVIKKSASPATLNSKKMIAVGRLDHQKGFERLIKIWAIVNKKFPDWSLFIYGNGYLKEDLAKIIINLKLENVIYLHESVSDIDKKYLESSALLMTSHYEGMPMVLLEGMANGLPLIAFDCPCGPKEIIENGVNGFIINNNDIDSFAQAIEKLITDYEFRLELGKNSYKIIDNYSINNSMNLWLQLFNQV